MHYRTSRYRTKIVTLNLKKERKNQIQIGAQKNDDNDVE